jgi:hypothetical protein
VPNILFISNDPPYATERSYDALRLAGSLSRRHGEEVKVFLIGGAAACAKKDQKVPQGYYNLALGKPLPKAGVFAHKEAGVVADNIAQAIAGHVPSARFDGHGHCFIEIGGGKAGFGGGDCYAEPKPAVTLRQPIGRWHLGPFPLDRPSYGTFRLGSSCCPRSASGPIAFDGLPIAARMEDINRWFAGWLTSESGFVDRVTSHLPPAPSNFVRIVALNEAGDFPTSDPTELEAGSNRCAVR